MSLETITSVAHSVLSKPIVGLSGGAISIIGTWLHWIPLAVGCVTAFVALGAACYSFISRYREAKSKSLEIQIKQVELSRLQADLLKNFCKAAPTCETRQEKD